MIYDAIIVGLGAMGSATAFHLARRGARTLGLDRYRVPHTLGSSHGRSRIIRQAYFEHPQYVPLVRRAYECWTELEQLSKRSLFVRTGGLMLGRPDSDVVRGALLSAREHDLAHESLSSRDLRSRFPLFHVADDTVAVWEPDAGFLRPESCIEAHLALAASHGATLSFDEPVLSWSITKDGVRVVTSRDSYSAKRLVMASGAWTSELVPAGTVPLVVERCVQHWFDAPHDRLRFDSNHFPVFIWELAEGAAWYGIPSDANATDSPGVKLALHHQGATSSHPDQIDRVVSDSDVSEVRALVQRFLPDADGPVRESAVCLYTNTPDEDFVIDSPADQPALLVVSACSGHGFKFSSAIGEAVAQTLLDGGSALDLSPFSLSRFH
jgi:sarcosine oxidase